MVRHARHLARVLASVAMLLSAPAGAQTPPPASDVTEPARQAPRRAGELEQLQRDAEMQRLLRPGREVTYEDVLANPDDIDINFAYAQIQIVRGDLRSAAATLERILLVNPDLPRVRLLYAIVLYRLDNVDEAERELRAVRQLEMPASLRAELDSYLEQIELRRKRTRYTALALLGFGYEWNRNTAAASNVNLLSDLPAELDGHSRRKQDQALIGLTRLDVSHDLGYQARHRLTGALTYYRGEQVHLSELDLQSASLDIGGVYDASPVAIIPNLYGRRLMLANKFYGYGQGFNLRAEHQLTADLQGYAYGEAERQVYKAIAEYQSAPEQSGMQYTLGGGLIYVLNPEMRVGAEIRTLRKDASRNYTSYDGEAVTLSHQWLFANGSFLITRLVGEIDRYDEADPLVSDLTRRDRGGRIVLTYGIPVQTLVDPEGEIHLLRDVTLLVEGFERRQVSNLTNYSYDNRGAAVFLTKRWEF